MSWERSLMQLATYHSGLWGWSRGRGRSHHTTAFCISRWAGSIEPQYRLINDSAKSEVGDTVLGTFWEVPFLISFC